MLNIIFEIAFFGPFDGDEHLVVLNETLQILGYVLMLQLFHQFHFLNAIISLFYVIDIKYFE